MKKLLALLFILLLSPLSYAGEVYFFDRTDPFTDKPNLMLTAISDDSNSFTRKVAVVYCTGDFDEPYLLFNNGGLYTMDNSRIITFRFDKNEPYEQEFMVVKTSLIAWGKDAVNRFLNNLEKSKSFIAKIENENGIIYFSEYGDAGSHIENFREEVGKLNKCYL